MAVESDRPPRARLPSRQSLGIPAGVKIILSFGLIRPYKGTDLLVEEFKLLDGDTHLIIAGYTSREQLREQLLQQSRDHSNIHCLLRWMQDDELAALLELSDIVVLPYKTVTNSGAALLALSAQRPILGPSMGSLPELQHLVGTEWVRLYGERISPSQIREAIAWLATPRHTPNMEPFSWPGIATATLAFYRSLMPRSGE